VPAVFYWHAGNREYNLNDVSWQYAFWLDAGKILSFTMIVEGNYHLLFFASLSNRNILNPVLDAVYQSLWVILREDAMVIEASGKRQRS
jgi:hypothetical protein